MTEKKVKIVDGSSLHGQVGTVYGWRLPDIILVRCPGGYWIGKEEHTEAADDDR